MGNRILKESICTSDNLDLLTPFQENFFYRLLVKADNCGRLDARLRLLSCRLFPLKDISVETVEETLQALEKAELIRRYQVDEDPYLQVIGWARHQPVRSKRSKYPAPEGEESAVNPPAVTKRPAKAKL